MLLFKQVTQSQKAIPLFTHNTKQTKHTHLSHIIITDRFWNTKISTQRFSSNQYPYIGRFLCTPHIENSVSPPSIPLGCQSSASSREDNGGRMKAISCLKVPASVKMSEKLLKHTYSRRHRRVAAAAASKTHQVPASTLYRSFCWANWNGLEKEEGDGVKFNILTATWVSI